MLWDAKRNWSLAELPASWCVANSVAKSEPCAGIGSGEPGRAYARASANLVCDFTEHGREYQCELRGNNADHVVSREIVPTTRASQPSAKSAANDALVVSKVRVPIADIKR